MNNQESLHSIKKFFYFFTSIIYTKYFQKMDITQKSAQVKCHYKKFNNFETNIKRQIRKTELIYVL